MVPSLSQEPEDIRVQKPVELRELAARVAVVPVLVQLLYMNVGLALFNMLPVPPLDGSRIVAWLLPTRFRDQWHQLETFSPFILLALFWLGRDLLGAVLGPPVDLVLRILSHLVEAVAR